MVAIALREWRLFGAEIRDEETVQPIEWSTKAEREPGLWQRVGEYWWLGLGLTEPAGRRTGMHDEQGRRFPPEADERYAWSAVFVSYVMRIAGAGSRFPYSQTHSDYINWARRASLEGSERVALRAEPIDAYAPEPGDLVCFGRGRDSMTGFTDLPTGRFSSHCDIVVGRAEGSLSVVGGNVADSVVLKHVPTTPDGRLAPPGAPPLDRRYPWFVVLRVLYEEEPSATRPAPTG